MAEVTVDKLRVEVKATAEGANKVFTQLAKQLETLKSASSFNTSGLTNLTNALNKVSTSLDTLSSKINTVNGKTVTPKINTGGVTSSQKKIDNSISKIRESLAGLTAYGNAAMSGDSSALTSFDRRVTSIQSSIDVLKARLESLGDTTVKVNAIDYYESKIEKAKDAIDQLVAKENEFKANGTDTGEAWDALQAKLEETREQLDALIQRQSEFSAGDMIDVDAFEDQKAALADFESQLHTTSDTVHNAVSTMNSQPVDIDTTPSQSNLSALAATLGSVSAQLLSVVGSAVISGFSKLSSAIKSVRNGISSLKSKVSGLSGAFNKGFFTILKYGFGIRSLYVLFRRLRQAVKDSFTELQNSGAYYETTRANVEALKSSLSILKYQFGAAFETIFNTVAPALQTFINYLISAMNTLSAFIAKLTGKSTYSKAVKATSDIAGNAGSAADSAKEMAKQLQGFDELNNLSGNSSGGSGGGGGSSGDSSGVTYVTESVDNALGSFTTALSDSINKGEWEKVGSLLSGKLQDMMDKIPWDSIYNKASKFGTNLANFLNGLFGTDKNGNNVFTSTGKTIASALNTALKFLNSFGKTFKWSDFGASLGSGITTFFKTFEWKEAGEALNTWITGILDAGIALLTTTDWEEIGSSLGEFLEGFDFETIIAKVTTFCSKLITAIGKVITGFQKNTTEKTKLETAIGGLIGVLAISKSVPLTLSFAATLAGLWLGKKFYEISSGNTVDQSFIEEVGDIIEGLFGENKIKFNLAEAISFVFDELTGQHDSEASDFEKNLRQWITLGVGVITGWTFPVVVSKLITFDWSAKGKDWENFKTDFWEGFKQALTTLFINGSPFSIPVNLFKILDFITEGTKLGDAINDLKSKFEEKWKKIWEGETYSETGANGMPSDVASQVVKTKGLKDLGKDMLEGIIQGFKDDFSAWTQPIKDMWDTFIQNIKDIFGISSPAKNLMPYGGYMLEGIIEGFKKKFNNLKTTIKNLWNKIKTWLKNYIVDKVSGVVNGIKTIVITAKGIIDNTFTKLSEAWEKIKTKTETLTAIAKEKVAGAIDKLQKKWTEFKTPIKELFTEAKEKVKGAIDALKDKWNNWSPKVKELLTEAKEKAENTIEGLKKKWDEWKGKGTEKTLTASASDGGSIDSLKTNWSSIKDGEKKTLKIDGQKLSGFDETKRHWQSIPTTETATKKLAGKHSGATWNDTKKQWDSVKDKTVTATIESKGMKALTDSYNYLTSFTLTVSFNDNFSTAFKKAWNEVANSVNNAINTMNNKLGTTIKTVPQINADGGSYYGGRWHSIPQYAKGTLDALNRGSMFIAGEAGPEIVGHINGRTEVLNRSQIAATMNSAIINGMSRFRNMQFNPALAAPYSGYAYSSDFSDNSYRDNDTAIMEQNRLLAEQNELLRQIANKNVTISSRDVFKATQTEANNFYNRTGNSPFLY